MIEKLLHFCSKLCAGGPTLLGVTTAMHQKQVCVELCIGLALLGCFLLLFFASLSIMFWTLYN